MNKAAVCLAAVAFAALPLTAGAQPILLKLSFFSSNRSLSYLAAVKPFVDAVNAEGKGLVEIDVQFSGALGGSIAQQPQLVRDGTTDMAFVVPGYTPDKFPDDTVVELPGLFRDMREASLVYTRLLARHALSGYEDFFVIGAYVTDPETIHSKTAIASIDDLKGKRIRVNNPGDAATFKQFGAIPVPLPINQIAEAISAGKIDAAAVSLTPLSDYGIKRVVSHHYVLETDRAPLALLMSRKSFEALPRAVQDIFRKYSGEWAALRFTAAYEASDMRVMDALKSDPHRTTVFPSQRDLEIADGAFKAVIAGWAAKSPHNRELLDTAEAEITRFRQATIGKAVEQ